MHTKKIALMTWYTHQNLGTALQASALSRVVERFGYTPSLIQYFPRRGAYRYNREYFINRCKNKACRLLNPLHHSSELDELYKNYLADKTCQTSKCSSYPELHDLNAQFDAFICGSDQIWTPANYDDKYFLSFVDTPAKMIAYAPSFGLTDVRDPEIRAKMTQLISRFQHLSVREEQGSNLIHKLTGQTAKVVVDPTLLLSSEEWNTFADIDACPKLLEKDYIICYFLGNSQKYMRYVQSLSKKLGLPYYIIPITQRQKKSSSAVPFEIGPREFISLIRNSRYVCTDSFHGIAFAVNYNVPFSVFRRFKENDIHNQNSRIHSLLHLLNLETRLFDYSNFRIEPSIVDCDFSNSNAALTNLRNSSLDYLEQALKHAVNSSMDVSDHPYIITDMCCGCGACASVCPHNAVTITQNPDGFEHYLLDPKKCILCGQCQKACPMTGIIAPELRSAEALYSVKSNSEQTLQRSSSGGTGHEIAKLCLKRNYAVCGCMYDQESNSAKHIWILPGEEQKLPLLQGSKYIQSISSIALKDIVEIAGQRQIAFFGTPCQAAAVDKLLRRKGLRARALIVDLICHGVPSSHLWKKYLHDVDQNYHTGTHPLVSFRSKEKESHLRSIRIQGNNHIYKKNERKDDFYAFFRRGLCDMNSCSDCPYREKSAADLRIGDYWGNRFKKEKCGISMVIACNQAGESILEQLQQNGICDIHKHNLSEYWSVQGPYNPPRPLIHEQLISELKNDSKTLHSLRQEYCLYYDYEDNIFNIISSIKNILRM